MDTALDLPTPALARRLERAGARRRARHALQEVARSSGLLQGGGRIRTGRVTTTAAAAARMARATALPAPPPCKHLPRASRWVGLEGARRATTFTTRHLGARKEARFASEVSAGAALPGLVPMDNTGWPARGAQIRTVPRATTSAPNSIQITGRRQVPILRWLCAWRIRSRADLQVLSQAYCLVDQAWVRVRDRVWVRDRAPTSCLAPL